jgi:hypothetical protein
VRPLRSVLCRSVFFIYTGVQLRARHFVVNAGFSPLTPLDEFSCVKNADKH